jgi:hypothetical protein
MTEMTLQQINKAIREAKKERAAIVAAQAAYLKAAEDARKAVDQATKKARKANQ